MKIGIKELKKIKETKKSELENILTNKFPDAEIFIIRGLDNFSYEYYIKSAYFDDVSAFVKMINIPANGSPGLCDTYEIYKETPKTLLNSRTFDEIDRMMIYDALEHNYDMEEAD